MSLIFAFLDDLVLGGSSLLTQVEFFWDSSLKVSGCPACCRPPVTSLILLELLHNPAPAPPAAPRCILPAGCWTPGRTWTATLDHPKRDPATEEQEHRVFDPWTRNFWIFRGEKERVRDRERETEGGSGAVGNSLGLSGSGLRVSGVLSGPEGPEPGDVQVCH